MQFLMEKNIQQFYYFSIHFKFCFFLYNVQVDLLPNSTTILFLVNFQKKSHCNTFSLINSEICPYNKLKYQTALRLLKYISAAWSVLTLYYFKFTVYINA